MKFKVNEKWLNMEERKFNRLFEGFFIITIISTLIGLILTLLLNSSVFGASVVLGTVIGFIGWFPFMIKLSGLRGEKAFAEKLKRPKKEVIKMLNEEYISLTKRMKICIISLFIICIGSILLLFYIMGYNQNNLLILLLLMILFSLSCTVLLLQDLKLKIRLSYDLGIYRVINPNGKREYKFNPRTETFKRVNIKDVKTD